MKLRDKDFKQIQKKGISIEQAESQISRIKNGICHSNLIAAANVGEGVQKFNKSEIRVFIEFYRKKKETKTIVKFVPASGASSRTFKFLFSFLKSYDPSKESLYRYINRKNDVLIKTFASNLQVFPFYNEVISKLIESNLDLESLSEGEFISKFVKTMLKEDKLNYGFLPKGLLPFHKYDEGVITAFQEHIFESTLYAKSRGEANVHFTVSEIHHKYFIAELNKFKKSLEEQTNTTFNVSFSYQKEATEVLALNLDNTIFRNTEGSILFRPGGHGALIENLNDLDADIVFIKNIDNIVTADKNIKISVYKELLAGVLIKTQLQVFKFLKQLDSKNVSAEDFKNIIAFATNKLNIVFDDNYGDLSFEEKVACLKDKFNRPIRVCGLVKNEGEPGGGPFWVKDKHGNVSIQIVEYAQIDFNNKKQSVIVNNATYFSPTDLVCGIKNYKGEKFNLLDYVDSDAAFITNKAVDGVDIKALELPGLWNGSMAGWNSIFVDVPVETFNPVKTINDLLRPAHQFKKLVH